MKNVTITVEERALEWVRIEAAKRNTSISRLVGEMLVEKMRHDDSYLRAYESWRADARTWCTDASPYPSREETYVREGPRP